MNRNVSINERHGSQVHKLFSRMKNSFFVLEKGIVNNCIQVKGKKTRIISFSVDKTRYLLLLSSLGAIHKILMLK